MGNLLDPLNNWGNRKKVTDAATSLTYEEVNARLVLFVGRNGVQTIEIPNTTRLSANVRILAIVDDANVSAVNTVTLTDSVHSFSLADVDEALEIMWTGSEWRQLAHSSGSVVSWSLITGKPSTILGYGITDAVAESRQVISGAGLTGGGDLSADRTLAVGASDSTITVAADGIAVATGSLTASHLSASAAIAETQIGAGGANNVLLGGASANSWGKVTAAMLATAAGIAATQLATGGANQVLWSNGTANSWTGAPAVTSVTASDYLKAGASAAATGTVRLPEASTIVAGTTTAVTTSATANTFNGPVSAVLAVAGTARLTATATTATFNFGSNDVVVGNGYVNIASAATTGGARILANGIAGREAYVTSRITGDTLDRHLLSLYGAAMVVGCHDATEVTGWDEVYVAANTAIHLTTTGFGAALTGVEVQDGLISLKAAAVSAAGYLTVGGTYVAIGTNPATNGAIRMPSLFQAYARNAANTDNVRWMMVDGSDTVILGDVDFPSRVNGTDFALYIGGATVFRAGAAALGFFGATAVAKPTVSGSRGGNAALADLLTELATLGLITNSTTA